MEKRKPLLVMAIDFGGSSTKIIGGRSFKQRSCFVMEPYVSELPKQLLRENNSLTSALPKDRAWVAIDDRYTAVGYLAQLLTTANPMLSQLKLLSAVEKVAAAVWVLKEQFKLPNQIRLALVALLPPGEYSNKQTLEERLRESLSSYMTPGGEMQVELSLFDCKPEGAGIFMHHKGKRGASNINQGIMSVLPLGYRNASALVFNRGNIADFTTSDLGFASMLKGIIRSTSGQTLERLSEPVAQWRIQQTDSVLKKILLSDDEEEELETLKEAIAIQHQKYTTDLFKWLSEVLPKNLDEVVLCGGTADYLRREMVEFFGAQKVYLHANVNLPDDIKSLNMENRWADVWCIWDYFLPTVNSLNKTKVAA
uniref:Actin-like protein N-terminal domain-containing protein n=2 Tax=Gloeothece TaxID=28070 RepID=E0UNH1_GLOV7|nr:conserved hypothetical protein [Gloeothece verrucosa PCC 7822]